MSPGADSTQRGVSSTYCRPVSLRPRDLPAGFIAPCLPSPARQPPSGELWLPVAGAYVRSLRSLGTGTHA